MRARAREHVRRYRHIIKAYLNCPGLSGRAAVGVSAPECTQKLWSQNVIRQNDALVRRPDNKMNGAAQDNNNSNSNTALRISRMIKYLALVRGLAARDREENRIRRRTMAAEAAAAAA